MKNTLLITCLFTLFCGIQAAHAKSSYYLEIGDEMKQTEAAQKWQSISDANQKLLKGLNYYPKAIFEENIHIATRIQAGPIASKQKAQSICKTLFAQDIACFVIENSRSSPPKSATSISDEASRPIGVEHYERIIRIKSDEHVTLPWLNKKTTQAEAQHESSDEGSMWSWLFGDDEDRVTLKEPAPIKVASRDLPPSKHIISPKDANVDVAEAIRVPLSTSSTPVIAINYPPNPNNARPVKNSATPLIDRIGELPSVAILDQSPVVTTAKVRNIRRVPMGNPSSDIVSKDAGWLNVASFKNESHASVTWQRVRKAIPAKAAGLRVRIIRPFISAKNDSTTLNVGPFASHNDAMEFCKAGIKPINNSLHCEFSQKNTVIANKASSYNALSSAAGSKVKRSTKKYWIEIIQAKNQFEALNEWEDIRTAHSDLLANKRSNISKQKGKTPHYVVRVGPINQNKAAKTLCEDLKSREINCNIVISSRN